MVFTACNNRRSSRAQRISASSCCGDAVRLNNGRLYLIAAVCLSIIIIASALALACEYLAAIRSY